MSRSDLFGVRVRVPATSANLGPGFDSFGLALNLYDDVEVTITSSGLEVEVEGEGAEVADHGDEHLIVRTLYETFRRIDTLAKRDFGTEEGPPPGLRLRCVNRIPHSRGLGSSSAAIVAGIVAARALHPAGALLDDAGALALATAIEGHPDNVAPCLAGGLTIAWTEPGGPRLLRLDPDPARVHVVALVPEQRLATELARGLLPEKVPHADAAANAARAALLVAALTRAPGNGGNGGNRENGEGGDNGGDDILLAATEDRLHQSYRAPAMPGSAAVVAGLRAAGVPAVISGAGPTVLAFGSRDRIDSSGVELGSHWHIHPLDVAPRGAYVRLSGS